MSHRLAYGFCTAICLAGLAGAAQAAPVTYTWETLSTVPPNGGLAPPLQLSFTVDGNLSLSANSGFAPPATPIPYSFPPQLLSFNLRVDSDLSLTLASFTSQNLSNQLGAQGYPKWSLGLTADPTTLAASLSLFFMNDTDTEEIYGPPTGSANPAEIGTDALSTIDFGADFYATYSPAEYTGKLVASAVVAPEPASLWLLIGGLGALGLIGPASAAMRRRRSSLAA